MQVGKAHFTSIMTVVSKFPQQLAFLKEKIGLGLHGIGFFKVNFLNTN